MSLCSWIEENLAKRRPGPKFAHCHRTVNRSPFHQAPLDRPHPLSRREFLWRAGGGLGGIALASLLDADRVRASSEAEPDSALRTPHSALIYPPRAKRVIQLFMAGAASHVDMFDFKPE